MLAGRHVCLNLYMCICMSLWIWSRPFLNPHYSLKDQQAYSIINACVFVNTTQKEMQRDIEKDME